MGSPSPSDQTLSLIPHLPNDIAAVILASIPFPHHSRLRSTCKSWKTFFSSNNFIYFRRNNIHPSRLSNMLCLFPQDPSMEHPYIFDPQTLAWSQLPLMPCNPHVYRLCNFSSIAVGHHIYVIGGSVLDTRSIPIERPTPSGAVYRYDVVSSSWEELSPLLTPRGSSACVVLPHPHRILVAGGGSTHAMFPRAGSSTNSVEMYEIEVNKWVKMKRLPSFRAGCVGFVGNEDGDVWLMGGYGQSTAIDGVFPVGQYFRDALVMELRNGGRWKVLGDMWEVGGRMHRGKIGVVYYEEQGTPAVFMSDGTDIFMYNMASNNWRKETTIPTRARNDSEFGFFALGNELYFMTVVGNSFPLGTRTPRNNRKSYITLLIQRYHPGRKVWRISYSNPPFHFILHFRSAVMCSIRL